MKYLMGRGKHAVASGSGHDRDALYFTDERDLDQTDT